MTEKVIRYTNHSTEVFEGFYESMLYNSDSIYNETYDDQEPPEPFEYDISDFKEFMNETSKRIAGLLHEKIVWDDGAIINIDYVGLYSPMYYNFETDKIILDITVNYEKLEKYCFEDTKETFEKYLKDNFTSCSGFVSFVPNNLKEFKEFKSEDNSRYDIVMVEYYMLNTYIWENSEEYLIESTDISREEIWDRLCVYNTETGDRYYYTFDDYNCIEIGDKI